MSMLLDGSRSPGVTSPPRPGRLRRLLTRSTSGGAGTGSTPASTAVSGPPAAAEGGWVAAMVRDHADALEVVRVARGLAHEGDGRLLLLVPQPATGLAVDATVHILMQRRREEAALEIVGRVLPALEDPLGRLREIRTQVVPYGRAWWPNRRPDGDLGADPVLHAVLSAASRAGAVVLVTPAALLPGPDNNGRPVLLDIAARRAMPTLPAQGTHG